MQFSDCVRIYTVDATVVCSTTDTAQAVVRSGLTTYTAMAPRHSLATVVIMAGDLITADTMKTSLLSALTVRVHRYFDFLLTMKTEK